jgi:Na+-translocating ferredoxin:NAD+ oxidoreductase RnfD subunit
MLYNVSRRLVAGLHLPGTTSHQPHHREGPDIFGIGCGLHHHRIAISAAITRLSYAILIMNVGVLIDRYPAPPLRRE